MAKQRTEVVRVLNISKQMISLQVKPPQGDFYLHEQQVRLYPGKSALLPKDHLLQDQLRNLQARRFVTLLYDSEQLLEQGV